MHLTLPKGLTSMEKSPFYDEDIIIICTRPAISNTFSPIDRNIEIPQTHRFRERKPDHNCKSGENND